MGPRLTRRGWAAVGAAASVALLAAVVVGLLPLAVAALPVVVGVVAAAERSVEPTLTRRGWSVTLVTGGAVAMALLYGTRALDAVAVPLILAVVAAGIAVWRADRPIHRRVLPENGHVGESRTVRMHFDVDTPEVGVVHDDVGEGLSATRNRVDTTIGDDAIAYEITYEERGAHDVGPLSVSVRDVLGLASTTFEYSDTGEVVAYPPVRPLAGATRRELNMLAGGRPERERDEFHRLREYVSGDNLRDVHWKTSAKQPDDELVVKEFVAQEEFGDVRIVAEGPEHRADAVAEAAASIAVNLLDRGVNVGVTVGDGSVAPSLGADHRSRLLELLARTDAGDVDVPRSDDAVVEVRATGRGVRVIVGDHETTYAALVGATRGERDPLDGGRGEPEVVA